jgi:type IV pilus assembly protein PilO
MEKLIERIVKAPLGTKIGVVGLTLALVTALTYFAVSLPAGDAIIDIEKKIKAVNAQQEKLDRDFIEKTAIANDLNRFRKEKERLEQQLEEAKAELPEQKNIDELLQLFQDRAQKAGLEINTIEPQPEVAESFFSRIPIPMTVTGNFHEIATYFDALGRLRRIVNVGDIALEEPKEVKGKVVMTAKFLVTTFMINQDKAPAADAKNGGAK